MTYHHSIELGLHRKQESLQLLVARRLLPLLALLQLPMLALLGQQPRLQLDTGIFQFIKLLTWFKY